MNDGGAVLTEKRNDSLLIIFNRPEIRSPLSVFVLEQLERILIASEEDGSVNRIVFTGKADVFASGADLTEIAALKREAAAEFGRRGQRLMGLIAESRKRTVAAVNGYCFGGALDLAISCGKRIASPDAMFCHPGVGLGIITGWGGTQRLPRLIGEAGALSMLLTARRVEAEEALRMGLVDEISETPLERALASV
jgi:enoyl-CoA hydratase